MLFFLNARLTFITSSSSSSTSRMFKDRSFMRRSFLVVRPPAVVFLLTAAHPHLRPDERERRPPARRRLDPHRPAAPLDRLLHQRQPDPRALDLVPSLERLE